ncbi:protein fluG [Penicillium robsamsonii]|uniref:protein fluG n=1 Tax=Penicillium robsamsonii TaxID=1792511 RepID=UPI002548D45C|nr:protein fluG [Penicillium robsamsonii]KAJ5816771.1 protein fluG [Penicillium robsamsonii]
MELPHLGQFTPLFTSQGVESNSESALQDFLAQHPTLRFIRLQWQDYSGILRSRMVVPKQLLQMTVAQKPIHAPPIAFHCVADNTLISGLDPTGNHFLVPDWSSLQILSASPHNAMVMCGVLASTPADPIPNHDLCPRRALASIIRRAKEDFDLDFLVGFEVEFELMEPTSELGDDGDGYTLAPACNGLGRYAVDGLRHRHFDLIEAAIHQLLDSGVDIQAFQTEGRRGQYELSLAPRTPLEAVDELILVHDTLKTIMARHGLIATMSPKPVAGRRQASGQHTHISISRPEVQDQFLAGILHRLPALCATCMPYDLSYERVQPYLGGDHVAWGSDNREVPIRKIRPGHWEIRCVDSTANMYLMLATTLGAGLLGVSNQMALSWPDTAIPQTICRDNHVNGTNGMNGTNGTNGTHHVSKAVALPRNLDSSLDLLEKEAGELGKMMNSTILGHFLRIKRFEMESLGQKSQADVRRLLTELF